MRRRSVHRSGLLSGVLLCWLGAGCAPVRGQAFEVAFAQASRDEGAGRFAEAAAAYDQAAAAARRERDRDQAKWDAGVLVARIGPTADALARLDDIASDGREHAAEAAYRAADLRIAQGDATGWDKMRQVAVRFPQHGVAHIAVRRLVEHARESGGEQGAFDELHALDLVAGSTEVGPLIAFLTAESIEARGDDAGPWPPTCASPIGGPTRSGPSGTTRCGAPACCTRSSASSGPRSTTSSGW